MPGVPQFSVPQSNATATGATPSVAGAQGYVPAPAAGEDDEFLRGDMTWQPIPGGGDVLVANNMSEFAAEAKRSIVQSNLNVPSNFDSFSRIAAQLGGVKFDGVTSGQRASTFLGDLNVGTNDVSISFLFRVPSSNPTATGYLFSLGSSSTAISSYGLYGYFSSSSAAFAVEHSKSSTALVNATKYNHSTFISNYGGKVILLTMVRSSATADWKFYVNNTDVTASFAITVGASGPAASETVGSQYLNIGGSSSAIFNDRIIRAALFNYALSAAEVATLYNDGILAEQRWVSYHGGNAILNIERNSTFAATTDWGQSGVGTSITSSGGVGAVVLANASDTVYLSSTYLAQLTPGVNHKLELTFSGGTWGGNTISAYWGVTTSDAATLNITAAGAMSADGTYNFEFTPPMGVGNLILKCSGPVTVNLDNVRVTKVLLTNGSFETVGTGGASATDNNIANGWRGTWTGGSTLARDTSNQYSGSACLAMAISSGDDAYFRQVSSLVVGRKYRFTCKAKAATGTPSFKLIGSSTYKTWATTTSYDTYTVDFTCDSTTVNLERATAAATYTIYFDDVELIELGALDAWGPAGLDDLTTLWRSDNPSSGHDATLFNLTQRSDGTYQNIILGYGRGAGERGNLGRISRESGTMSLGGISLPGNANQRLTIATPAGATDIGTNSFWVRAQFVCPASNPAASQGLWTLTSSATSANAAGANYGFITTSGKLEIAQIGSSTSNYRFLDINDFVSRYGGRVVDVVFERAATGSVTVWVNGSVQAFTEGVSGTPPAWNYGTIATYFHVGNAVGTRFIGEYYRFQVGRGVLTDAMVRQVYNAGIGTGSGGAGTTTPISRGGVMGSTDGVVIDLDLATGAGNFFPDKSGNGYHAYSNLTDHTHKLPKSTGLRMYDKIAWTGTPTATKIGAGAVTSGIVLPLNAIIHRIVVKTTVATTGTGITIGDGSNATRYVLSTPIVSGYNDLPLNYTGSDGTNTTISVVPDSVNYTGTMHITVFYELADIV